MKIRAGIGIPVLNENYKRNHKKKVTHQFKTVELTIDGKFNDKECISNVLAEVAKNYPPGTIMHGFSPAE